MISRAARKASRAAAGAVAKRLKATGIAQQGDAHSSFRGRGKISRAREALQFGYLAL
jgi:hypothetical protein